MTIPLSILAVLSSVGGLIGLPQFLAIDLMGDYLNPVFSASVALVPQHHISHAGEISLMAISTIVALIGVWLAYKIFPVRDKERKFEQLPFYKLLMRKYYVDEVYTFVVVKPLLSACEFFYRRSDMKVIDGIVNGAGKLFIGLSEDWRKVQTGIVQDYAVISIAGLIGIIAFILFL